ncbi:hypothetical protein KDH_75180 [Dictyobacter sp. S3.2.2.5]|uniref:Transcription regulator PadR N-terminal domain-containing protein n=1 Tax=Dictyobacter halimunensis TaxID=3026934 RepID=A0ABQ6G2E4_9CHLR|nr:hypothetical protein KDH_75180 [Dictyobacter sp. S3.2.2.5]
MYELIVLSLLMRFPLHGYLLAQIANDMIGPWAKISNGTLYPLLNRLERSGLIERAGEVASPGNEQGEQQARTFRITEAGRKRFHQVMLDTSSNIGDYQRIFHLKMPYLDLLPVRERLHLLNHYLNYCQACVLHLQTHAASLLHEIGDEQATFRDLALGSMRQREQLWQAEIEWVRQLRAQVAE